MSEEYNNEIETYEDEEENVSKDNNSIIVALLERIKKDFKTRNIKFKKYKSIDKEILINIVDNFEDDFVNDRFTKDSYVYLIELIKDIAHYYESVSFPVFNELTRNFLTNDKIKNDTINKLNLENEQQKQTIEDLTKENSRLQLISKYVDTTVLQKRLLPTVEQFDTIKKEISLDMENIKRNYEDKVFNVIKEMDKTITEIKNDYKYVGNENKGLTNEQILQMQKILAERDEQEIEEKDEENDEEKNTGSPNNIEEDKKKKGLNIKIREVQ